MNGDSAQVTITAHHNGQGIVSLIDPVGDYGEVPYTTGEFSDVSGTKQTLTKPNWTYTWPNLQTDAGNNRKYVYKVREVSVDGEEPSAAGFIAEVDKPNGVSNGTITLTNTEQERKGSLSITKAVSNGNASGKTFTFNVALTPASGATIEGTALKVNGTTIDSTKVSTDGTTGVVTATVTVTGTGTVTLSEIPAGTTYLVSETNLPDGWQLSSTNGVVYQNSQKTITANNTDSVTVNNTYNATGDATFSGTKSIANRNFKAGDSFTIQVEGADNAPMPGTTEAGSTYTKTVTLTADQAAANTTSFAYTLDAISYSLSDIPSGEMSKQFTYTVTESAATMDGVAAVDSTSYTVTVTISDNGDGTLDVVKSGNYNALNFTNTYDASGSVPFSALKVLSGRKLAAEDYSFELVDSNGAVIQTKQNDANGNVMFDAVNYTLSQLTNGTATFTYTIREVLPNTATSSNNYTVTTGNNTTVYDNHDVTVTVTVTDDGDGTLEVEKTSTYTATSGKRKISSDADWTTLESKTLSAMSAEDAATEANRIVSFDHKYPKYDANGNLYTYQVFETEIAGYTAGDPVLSDQEGASVQLFTVTNTPNTMNLYVHKEWYDGTKAMDNALAGSLAQVQYQVYRQGYLDSEFATACGSEEQITLPSGVTGTLPTSTTTTDETTGIVAITR